ncbi:hypothetical protein BJV82DRAFT_583108 [Fennellomyces sp. T-0311]|nr:hypothetical protein BJV82DRAFT_583108 [Fennellomyces sp. T-0311]
MMRIRWTNPQQGRVHKRSPKPALKYTKKPKRKEDMSLPELENELAYSVDSLATISVMFDSLRHAYATSKPQMDRSSTATRLGDMEKELLTAYDDLGLQVVHLERHINKLERQIKQLTPQTTPETPTLVLDEDYSPLPLEATPPPVYDAWSCDAFAPPALIQTIPCACAECSCNTFVCPPFL